MLRADRRGAPEAGLRSRKVNIIEVTATGSHPKSKPTPLEALFRSHLRARTQGENKRGGIGI